MYVLEGWSGCGYMIAYFVLWKIRNKKVGVEEEGSEGLFRRFVEVFEGAFGFPFFCVFRDFWFFLAGYFVVAGFGGLVAGGCFRGSRNIYKHLVELFVV